MPSAMEDVRAEAARIYAIVFTNTGIIFYRSSFEGLHWETQVRNCKMKKDMAFDFIYDNSRRILPDGTVETRDYSSGGPTAAGLPVGVNGDDLETQTIQRLRATAKSEGISVSGSKEDIMAAIRDNRRRNETGSLED